MKPEIALQFPERSSMRLMQLGLLLMFRLIPVPAAHGQTALETKNWIETFLASKGGTFFSRARFSPDGLYEPFVRYEDGHTEGGKVLFISDVKKIEPFTYTSRIGSGHGVRLTGKLFSCNGVGADQLHVMTDVRAACSPSQGRLEIDFKDQGEQPNEDCKRFIKALTHWAEIEGAKVNQPEIF